jgi:agmatine/peptidylarginine deiminase
MRIKLFIISVFVILALTSWAQINNNGRSNFQGKYHMLSKEELNKPISTKDFVETAPPEGPVRNIAEFERNQGVIVANLTYNQINYFGFPDEMIVEMCEDAIVYILVDESNISDLTDELSELSGINMDNIVFIDIPYDSKWTRDFSPWFIAHNNPPEVGIVNFQYNRDRPADNDVPIEIGAYFNINVFGMNVIHTGGNYMCDGMGVAASTNLVYEENDAEDIEEAQVDTRMEDYLGITNYHVVPDPQGEYIAHIDCWGKFLDVDKILITEVPPTNSQYDLYEAAADYWANQTSSYGNKYQVFRVYTTVDNDAGGAPYTNSLILNNKVLVPLTEFETWEPNNANALAVYEEAMPGYEIIGVTEVNYAQWQNTDALHCRTHEVPDFEMLHLHHMPYFDTVGILNTYPVHVQITSYGNHSLIADMPKLHYRINGGDYSVLLMETNGEDSYIADIPISPVDGMTVEYYIEAEDESGRNEKHPFIGAPDPHKFVIKDYTNIHSYSRDYIKIFPNPATDHINLIVNNLPNGMYQYSIINIEGKQYQQGNIQVQNTWQRTIINTTEFPKGLYLIKISHDKVIKTSRFVIK